MSARWIVIGVAATAIAACSGPDDGRTETSDTRLIVVDTTALVADPAPDATVGDTTRDASEEGEVVPAGGATLTIGDRTWTFPGIVCLFDEDATEVDAEFAMSGVTDGYELYAEIADTGHVITLDDIDGVAAEHLSFTTADASHFLRVSGSTVTAETQFVPVDDPDAEPVPGQLDATCA